MGFFEGLNLYASVAITMLKVVAVPLMVWLLLGRPKAWWPYVAVCLSGLVALLLNEGGDLIAAWWNRDSAASVYLGSPVVDDKLLNALQVRSECVALAVLAACGAFFFASE